MNHLTNQIFEAVVLNPQITQEEVTALFDKGKQSQPIITLQIGSCRKVLTYLQRIGVLKYQEKILCRVNWDEPKTGTCIVVATCCEPNTLIDDMIELGAAIKMTPQLVRQIYNETKQVLELCVKHNLVTDEYIENIYREGE